MALVIKEPDEEQLPTWTAFLARLCEHVDEQGAIDCENRYRKAHGLRPREKPVALPDAPGTERQVRVVDAYDYGSWPSAGGPLVSPQVAPPAPTGPSTPSAPSTPSTPSPDARAE